MAVSETQTVPTVVLSGNPIVSKVHSNNCFSGTDQYAGHRLVFTDKAAAGKYFTISLLNGAFEIVFTAAAAPDDSGKQFPSGTGAADATYLATVKSWVAKNFIIASHYTVTVVSSVDLYIAANEYGPEYGVEFIDNNFAATYAGLGAGLKEVLKENFAVHGKLKVYEDGVWEEIIEDRMVPDNAGDVEFNFQEVIDAYLKNLKGNSINCQYPDNGSVEFLKERTELVRCFAYDFAEYYGIPYQPESIRIGSAVWYSIEGGFSKMFLAYLQVNSSNFYIRLVSKDHFLTWSYNGKKVHVEQFDRLYYLNLFPISTIIIRVFVYFSDNSSTLADIITLTGTSKYKVYEVVTSPGLIINAFSGSIPAGEHITRYTIRLINASLDAISEDFTINVDYNDHEALRYFIFKNSFGVFETIYTVGTGIKTASYKRVSIQKILGSDYTNLDFENTDNQVIEGEALLVNTGFFPTIDQLERFRDFLISTTRFEIINGTLVPIQMLTTKSRIREDKYYNYALEFEYRRSYESEYYSIDEFSGLIAKALFSDSGTAEFSSLGSAKFDK